MIKTANELEQMLINSNELLKILAVKFTNFWLSHLFVIQSELNDFLVDICFNPCCLTLLLDPALRIVTSKQARLVHDRGSPARLGLAGIRACRGSGLHYSDQGWVLS